ncbi:MAG: PAS domain S-box protein [Rhodospirillales bacterium]
MSSTTPVSVKQPPVHDRILIVDDEQQVLNALTDELEDDFDIVTETSAAKALARIEKDSGISVILCDQRMPDMTGDELLTKAQQASLATRVMITGYADLDAVVRAVNNGKVFGYVSKPWDMDNLKMVVVNAIEHNHLERALKREQQLFKSLMETSSDAISIVDTSGRFVRANEGARQFYGAPSVDEMIGNSFSDFLNDERAKLWLDEGEQIVKTGESIVGKVYEVKGDNQTTWHSASKSPLRNEVGDIVGVFSITRDITDLKRFERKLQSALNVTGIAAAAETEEDAIGGILTELATAVGADYAEAWVDYSDTNPGRLLDSYHGEGKRIGDLRHTTEEMAANGLLPLARKAWQTREPQWIADGTKAGKRNFLRVEAFERAGLKSVLAIPVRSADGDTRAVYGFAFGMTLDEPAPTIDFIDGSIRQLGEVLDRKRARDELARREQQLSLIAEHIDEAIWMADGEFERSLYVSPATERVWGVPAEGFYDDPDDAYLDLVVEDDREAVKNLYAAITEEPQRFRFRIRRPDGEVRWLEERTYPIKDDSGRTREIVGVSVDITDDQTARAKLEQWSRRYNAAADAAAIGVWDFDVSTGELVWDDRMFDIYGVAPDDFGGTVEDWQQRVHPDDLDRVTAELTTAIERNETFNTEFRIVRPDGEVRHLTANGHLVENEDGSRGLQIVGANVDVTDHRNAEAQLMQVQKMDAVGQLTGGVAHDFNNILTVIKGNLQLATKQPAIQENAKLNRWLTASFDAANRGADLTRRLLTFSRRQTLESVVADPNEIVAGMHEMFVRTIGEDIELTTFTDKSVSRINTDVGQFENVLLNLVVNARDAMPDGGQLTIEVANSSLDETYVARFGDVRPGRYVMVAVTDTGTGIPPAVADKIFDPFFTTKEAGKGTGLGLSMVFGFVKQAGGHMSYYTEQGLGTTFRLYFPVFEGDAEQAADDTGAEPVAGATARPAKILLVDDDAPVRETAKDVLEDNGYTVVCAGSGAEALDRLGEHEDVELLFTDIVMPGGMNGLELAKECLARRPELKVIYASGYAEEALRRTNRDQIQPGDWVGKPYDIEQLGKRVQVVLEGHDAGTED